LVSSSAKVVLVGVGSHARDFNRAQQAGVPSLQARTGKAGVGECFPAAATMSITHVAVLNIMEGGNQVAATIEVEADVPGAGTTATEELPLWTFDEDGKSPGAAALQRHGQAHRRVGQVSDVVEPDPSVNGYGTIQSGAPMASAQRLSIGLVGSLTNAASRSVGHGRTPTVP
jgi:hypothetical protein